LLNAVLALTSSGSAAPLASTHKGKADSDRFSALDLSKVDIEQACPQLRQASFLIYGHRDLV
jgi:hypothetical protein